MTALNPPGRTGTKCGSTIMEKKGKLSPEQVRERKTWVSQTKQEPSQTYFIQMPNINQFATNNHGSSTGGNDGKDSLTTVGVKPKCSKYSYLGVLGWFGFFFLVLGHQREEKGTGEQRAVSQVQGVARH